MCFMDTSGQNRLIYDILQYFFLAIYCRFEYIWNIVTKNKKL